MPLGREETLNRLISILLILSIAFSCMLSLSSCGANTPPEETPGADEPSTPHEPTIKIPEFGGWDRGTVAFDKLTYARPNVNGLISDFEAVSEEIRLGEKSFEELTEAIDGLDEGYADFRTMYSLSEIFTSKDASNEFWQTEHEYLSTNAPSFSQAVEGLFVAAAQSGYRARFEEDYFGYSLEEYVDGGIYTDELVELLAEEAALEAESSAISTANIQIEYEIRGESFKGSVNEVLEAIKEKYGEMSSIYNNSITPCLELFKSAKARKQCEIYVELVRLRSLIATEMGCESYIEVGYKNTGHDYSKEQMENLLDDIGIIYQLYNRLWYAKLEADVNAQLSKEQSYITTVNRLGNLYLSRDKELYDIYSYMLYYGLFDIAPEGGNRYEGAFTTYIDSNNSPYLFMSADNKQYDYLTLAHEFGHFADMYLNYGSEGSLDISEVSSQGLEYLTMGMLSEIMSDDNHRILVNKAVDEAIWTLFNQGILSIFEHSVYELEYDEITREKLDELVGEAFEAVFGFDIEGSDNLEKVMMVHTIEYPFYVQSYFTSLIAALEIFFMEENEPGAGLAAYKAMLYAIDDEKSFAETLMVAGIKSPLRDGSLIDLANDLHYYYFGKPYIDVESGTNTAAA